MSATEPEYAKSMRSKKDSPWYLTNIDKNLVPDTRKLLEEYSHVRPNEVSAHIHNIRDKAWDIRAYPCTGLGRWLVPTINLSPAYSNIHERLRAGDNLMDVGAYLGQDLRKLVFDGAPSEHLIAVDIVSHWDLGFEMYRDANKFSARFIEADILGEDPELLALRNRVNIICVFFVLHQWSWEEQVRCCKRFVELSKEGTIVVGLQIGHIKGHQFEQEAVDDAGKKQPKVSIYRHGPESFVQMWKQVGEETSTSWTTEAHLRTWEEVGWDPADQRWLPDGCGVLDFVVTRR